MNLKSSHSATQTSIHIGHILLHSTVVMKVIAPVIILLASSFRVAFSHPEGTSAADVERAVNERSAHHVKAQRALGDCANSLEAQALRARAAARRAERTRQLRQERGITESEYLWSY